MVLLLLENFDAQSSGDDTHEVTVNGCCDSDSGTAANGMEANDNNKQTQKEQLATRSDEKDQDESQEPLPPSCPPSTPMGVLLTSPASAPAEVSPTIIFLNSFWVERSLNLGVVLVLCSWRGRILLCSVFHRWNSHHNRVTTVTKR